jgi:hypothetical protein
MNETTSLNNHEKTKYTKGRSLLVFRLFRGWKSRLVRSPALHSRWNHLAVDLNSFLRTSDRTPQNTHS